MNDSYNESPAVYIKNIKFNNGKELNFNEDDIIILVGANNVGKSRMIKDIKNDLTDNFNNKNNKVIIKDINYTTKNFNYNALKNYFEKNFYKDNYGNFILLDEDYNYHSVNFNADVNERDKQIFRGFFSYLSTENRLLITKPIFYNNINNKLNFNIMTELENKADYIEKLNNFLFDAFEKGVDIADVKINNDLAKNYKIGSIEEIKKTLSVSRREASAILERLENLNEQGDGIRSSVGILGSLIVNKGSIYLIDEPETFLHPPQAKLLGSNIVDLSKNKQCFISTHNIDIIKGIMEKNSSRVKIIKIDREGNTNEFHMLDNKSISKIAENQSLKYSNLLNGLFYKNVVLTEDETDSKFYSAILENVNSKKYQETLFCGVGGKDQFKIIVKLLKELHINYSIIADIDLISDAHKLKQLCDSCLDNGYSNISDDHHLFLNQFQSKIDMMVRKQSSIKEEILSLFNDDKYISESTIKNIKDILKEGSSLKVLKKSGKSIIPSGECMMKYERVVSYLKNLKIYILECGEIEGLVKTVEGHGSAWVSNVFRKYPNMSDEVYYEAKAFIEATIG